MKKHDIPKHYVLDGLDINSMDIIKAVLTKEEFQGFCKGNILKYNIRARKKNGKEDYKKSKDYTNYLLETFKEE